MKFQPNQLMFQSHQLVMFSRMIGMLNINTWTLAIKNNKNTLANVKRTMNVMVIELVPSMAGAMVSVTANINLGLFHIMVKSNLAGNK